MALTIKTDNPTGLLAAIKKGIDNNEIITWSYDDDGDFTHTPEQWKKKAWLRPKFENSDELKFITISPKNVTLTKEIIGIYYGRFAEMLIAHFSTKFSTITVVV
jgi:hypothetical protein